MFERTAEVLESDTLRRTVLMVVVATTMLVAWSAWFFFARLPEYAVSRAARFEVVHAPFHAQAPVRGRITAILVDVGDEVEGGAALMELDTEALRLELSALRLQLAALDVEVGATLRQGAALSVAADRSSDAGVTQSEQARALHREAQAAEQLAKLEASRAAPLVRSGVLAEIERDKAESLARQRSAARQALQIQTELGHRHVETELADRQVELARLERDVAGQDSERAKLEAQVSSVKLEIERRVIRSPTAGRVADLAKVQVGAWVDEGDSLAWVVPVGPVEIVAEFEADASLGRIAPGQSARFDLDGFPWTQFGRIEGRVLRVAGELREGRIAVDISIDARTVHALVPLQHGLPGVAEVVVDDCSPAEHVLRAFGR